MLREVDSQFVVQGNCVGRLRIPGEQVAIGHGGRGVPLAAVHGCGMGHLQPVQADVSALGNPLDFIEDTGVHKRLRVFPHRHQRFVRDAGGLLVGFHISVYEVENIVGQQFPVILSHGERRTVQGDDRQNVFGKWYRVFSLCIGEVSVEIRVHGVAVWIHGQYAHAGGKYKVGCLDAVQARGEWELRRIGIFQLNEEARVTACGRVFRQRAVNARRCLQKLRGRPLRFKDAVSEIAFVRGGCLPKAHGLRRIAFIDFHADGAVRLEGLGKFRQCYSLGYRQVPGRQAARGIILIRDIRIFPVPHAVPHVGQKVQMFHVRQRVEIELGGIRDEELITGGIHHEFGHVLIPPLQHVFVGVYAFQKGLGFRRQRFALLAGNQLVEDAFLCVGIDSRAPVPVGGAVMFQVGFHVQHIDDNGGDCFNARVDGSGQPCCPTPLRCARHHEILHLDAIFRQDSLRHIHGAHDRFDHGI
ncbi:MAG: hypothetical protein BWX80_02517 [Candidatus Hydrogenedentes bacterium ADurb.Bin101]|nr:MAG: hypothetical protein BWX80_02517 [Candidatus Hydrogenedentes bacterium ADurb.Bin101]